MILMAAELGVKTVDRIVNGPKERRKEPGYLRNRRAFMGATALVACLGVVAGSENVTENTTVNHTIEAGEAVVQYIDRELSEQHVIGFTTKVDGTYAEQVVQRKGWFGIDLPDLVNGMTIDNYVVQSSLCFDGGTKRIKETIDPDGSRHYEVRIDPADIRVCSKQDPNELSIATPSANFIENVNNLDNDFKRILTDNLNIPISDATITKENELKSELTQAAQNMATNQVNLACGPKVFDVTIEDAKELIADDIRRSDDETVEVIFEANANGEIAISGQSDLHEYFAIKKAAGWNITGGSVGECTLPESVVEGSDERTK